MPLKKENKGKLSEIDGRAYKQSLYLIFFPPF